MAKKTATTRVHQLAKRLGVSSKDIVAKCVAEEIPGITNHMSAVSLGLEATITEWFGVDAAASSTTTVEKAAPVDVEAVKARASKKAARKKTTKKKKTAAGGGSKSSASAGTAVAEPDAKPAAPKKPAKRTADAKVSRSTEPAATPDKPAVLKPRTVAPATSAPESTDAPTTTSPARVVEPSSPPASSGSSGSSGSSDSSPATTETPDAPAIAASAPEAGGGSPPPIAPASNVDVPGDSESGESPKMNVPDRPKVIKPLGRVLSRPAKTALSGPKVVRVESPEPAPVPRRPRTQGDRPMGGGGPRRGGGVGAPMDMPMPPGGRGAPGGGAGGGGAGGGAGSRRNKRRSASARPDGRSGRAGLTPASGEKAFNWREQDLLERERRLNRASGFIRQARRDNQKRSGGSGGSFRAKSAAQGGGGTVSIEEPITIKSLSAATGVRVNDIINRIIRGGGDLMPPDSVIETELALEMMLERDIELDVVEQKTAEELVAEQFVDRDMVDEQTRSPVVTILGHVDHGKTTLLDSIRKANVAAGEAGGITQATSAFRVPVQIGEDAKEGGRIITFIDTPGHEAFTEMRSRGAKVTDVVILVVAADDGVMPQTIESINHAKAAEVPIIIALNKVDKEQATDSNIQRILGQLAEQGLNPSEWGGDTEIVRLSALKGEGIQDLLELIDLNAQVLELTADFGGRAEGTVIEAQLEEGRGSVARVLVQQGKLKKGDYLVIGRAYGRVRDIVNDRGERVKSADPSTPVAISGMNEVADAGDKFYVVKNLREAEAAAAERKQQEREKGLANEKVTLDNIFQKLSESGRKELPLIVKTDVQGSLETLRVQIPKIGSDEVSCVVKHSAVGGVNESDVQLAEASGAIIVGFNVTAPGKVRKLAEQKKVDIRFYDVIYDLTDDVTKAAEGLLDPELKLEVLGHAEVRAVFKVSKVGMVAGCYVTDGNIQRNAQIRVTRDDIVVEKDRRLVQLKRFKDEVKEVNAGQECGMKIDGYDDIREGDVLECYLTKEVRRTLNG